LYFGEVIISENVNDAQESSQTNYLLRQLMEPVQNVRKDLERVQNSLETNESQISRIMSVLTNLQLTTEEQKALTTQLRSEMYEQFENLSSEVRVLVQDTHQIRAFQARLDKWVTALEAQQRA
jgi:septal ring factor EnvC (AmiA/AmiB activator)